MTAKNDYILRVEDYLRKNRQAYHQAKKLLSDFPTILLDELFSYRPGESGEKAIYVLAACQRELLKYREAQRFVKDYEGKEEQIEKLRAADLEDREQP